MIDRRRPARPLATPTWAVALLGALVACLPGIAPADDAALRQAAWRVAPSAAAMMVASPGLASVAHASETRSDEKEGDRPTAPDDPSSPSAALVGLWLAPPRTAAHPWTLVPRAVTGP